MMKVFFDSSVLVAAIWQGHINHKSSLKWVEKASLGQIDAFMSTHSMAELYSVLTGHPKLRISPQACQESLELINNYIKPVSLNSDDYNWAIKRMANINLAGGSIYDALHARAALNSNADILLTLNKKHFLRLGKDISKLLKDI